MNGLAPPRLAVGLGDPDREGRLLPFLSSAGHLDVTRYLSADDVLAAAERGACDAVLVAHDLPRLVPGLLEALARLAIPMVLLTASGENARDSRLRALPLASSPDAVWQALVGELSGTRRGPWAPPTRDGTASPATVAAHPAPPVASSGPGGDRDASGGDGVIVAVWGGPGSPGRTTVAVNLAAALATVDDAILVDLDLAAPSVAARLDLDPTRNLAMLANAAARSPGDWTGAIEGELQPLADGCPHGRALGGVPELDLGVTMTAHLVETLLVTLRGRARFVVLDVGTELVGPCAAAHLSALRSARWLFLTCTPDLVGIWRARQAWAMLRRHGDVDPDRVALVVNQHSRRAYAPGEVALALDLPLGAVVPEDRGAVHRARADQRPLVLAGRGRASDALVGLAGRLFGGPIRLPTPQPATVGSPRGRMARMRGAVRRGLRGIGAAGGAMDGSPHWSDGAPVRAHAGREETNDVGRLVVRR